MERNLRSWNTDQMNSNDLIESAAPTVEQGREPMSERTGQIRCPKHRRDLRSTKAVLRLGLLMLVVFGLILVLGYIPRFRNKEAIARAAKRQQERVPVVAVTAAVRAKSSAQLSLPGSSSAALMEAPIYARASGYVTKRLVDIGDHVKAGQLLAMIDAPDLDQQVDQASRQPATKRIRAAPGAGAGQAGQRHLGALQGAGGAGRSLQAGRRHPGGELQRLRWPMCARREDTVNANRANLRRLTEVAGL